MKVEKVNCNGGTRLRVIKEGREILVLWKPFFGEMTAMYMPFDIPVKLLQEALDFVKEEK